MTQEYLTLLAAVAAIALSLVLLSPPRRRPQVAAAGGAIHRRGGNARGDDPAGAFLALHVSGIYEANLSAVDLPEELGLPEGLIDPDELVRPAPAAAPAAVAAPSRHAGWQSNVLFFALLAVLYTIDRFWALRTSCLRLIPSRKLRAWALWSWRRPARFGRRHLDR